jgi:flavin reductase (DIM6/NTAB) family NADH-FMN oxidoreductase RutF
MVHSDEFRRVVGHFATGVTVVTTYAEGTHHAMTANAFTSVSLDPVLVLVAIERRARFHEAVLAAGTFAVNVLAADQEDLSRWASTRGRDGSEVFRWPFAVGAASGAAVFDGVLAALECRTYATHPGGDHTLVVGEVAALSAPRPHADPLLYYKGLYRVMASGPESPDPREPL